MSKKISSVSSSARKDSGASPRQQGPAASGTVKSGTLFIVATPIGNLKDMSARAIEVLQTVDAIAAEDTRTSGKLLRYFDIKTPMIAYHDHNETVAAEQLVARLQSGQTLALISDAGLPLIADPGYRLIGACAEAGISVTVVPGANAALAALILSGLPTDRFYFHGFLPAKSGARIAELQSLIHIGATLIFYEAPHRLQETLQDAQTVFGNRPAAVVREITKMYEEARRGPLADLIAHYTATDPRGECVLIIGGHDKTQDAPADIDALLTAALKTLKVRDAAKAVAAETGEPVSELYARALRLKDLQ